MRTLKNFLIAHLSNLLFLAGLLVGLLAVKFFPRVMASETYGFPVSTLIFSLWGASGLVAVLRREAPARGGKLTGRLAVIYGWIMLISWWFLALLSVLLYARKIL